MVGTEAQDFVLSAAILINHHPARHEANFLQTLYLCAQIL